MEKKDYIEINRQSWNNRADVHYGSEFYDNQSFIAGRSSLNQIERELIGDVVGKSVLHLQCHFGQDTISLSRLGATATGVDLSDRAIAYARELATTTNADCNFICCDVYDLPNHLDETYDMVFTSYGTIGWLPDIDRWAAIVSRYLKPNGRLVFAEFHPVLWMFDDDFQSIKYRYFNTEPIHEVTEGTYAEKEAAIKPESVSWNHGLGEVVSALLKNGLRLDSLQEYDYSPYNCFNGAVEVAPNKFRIEQFDDKIPMVYSLSATKD